MKKKTYISVKCGLVREPKHRQAIGECIWLFLYMIDHVDWESGTIPEWKDESAAEDMGMPVRTLREQRRKLDELGYISCKQKQYAQEITIYNWTNPREYSGEVKNQKQGDVPMEPQGYTQGDIQGSTQNGTPTYSSKNQQSINDEEESAFATISRAYEAEIGVITPFIANAIDCWIKDGFPVKWIADAIHEAAVQNKRSWKYCEAIIKRWNDQGNQNPMKPIQTKGKNDANRKPNPTTHREPTPDQDAASRKLAAQIRADRAARQPAGV